MISHGLREFSESLAVEEGSLFIVYRGKRCWLDWHVAREFAFFEGLISRRRQSVHGVFVAGRWYWHVRVVPPSSPPVLRSVS